MKTMLTRNNVATMDVVLKVNDLLVEYCSYEAKKKIARNYLGVHQLEEGQVLFGFWVPGIQDGFISKYRKSLKLSLYRSLDPERVLDQPNGEYAFDHFAIDVETVEDYVFCVVDQIRLGEKDCLGDLYWLTFQHDGIREIIRDPLAFSLPFGVYAMAEAYDTEKLLGGRKDTDYYATFYKAKYESGYYQAKDIGMCLEIHTETGSEEGTIAGLTRKYKRIAATIRQNMADGEEDIYEGLTVADKNMIGFDSIELMPEVPTSEREIHTGRTGEFFKFIGDETGDVVEIQLGRPNISNWGYDTPVLGSVAVSPSLLESLRPDEMLEFIETIHTMPDKPIQMAIDSVLGHCDFQGAFLLETFEVEPETTRNPQYVNSKYLTGSNMYGRDIDFSNENVKSILLELLRRKIDFGYDCIRIDGAQDFVKEIDALTGLRIQDDDFLKELVSVEQDINGVKRYLDINLEDGRPWPDDLNWLYNSKYLDHSISMTLQEDVVPKQWSPIIFAHNVHGKFKWFMDKWDRFVEVYRYGEHWITGQSNHDNARYYYKMVSSKPSVEYKEGTSFAEYYNSELGDTKKEVVHNAMDHNGLSGMMLAFLPGNPLFLLNALVHTPWMFLRDIDHTYAVDILSNEGAKFFEWYVDKKVFQRKDNFLRAKEVGFTKYEQLMQTEDSGDKGFLNRLYELAGRVKTGAVTVRFLFESTDDEGHYETLADLKHELEWIINPSTKAQENHSRILRERIKKDEQATGGFNYFANGLLQKNLVTYQQEVQGLSAYLTGKSEEEIHEELVFLKKKLDNYEEDVKKIQFLLDCNEEELALLLSNAAMIDAYDVIVWCEDEELNALATDALKVEGKLDADLLVSFANLFLKDALDACKVNKYEDELDPDQVQFNFDLRQFRGERPWLLRNPTNNIRKDYFARKLYINGAKDTGDWGDKGDIVNCNTVYYGWRAAPEGDKQIFVIANMEGKPIADCPLNLFINMEGDWQVKIHSPGMKGLPTTLDRHYRIKDFKNGEIVVLERSLKGV